MGGCLNISNGQAAALAGAWRLIERRDITVASAVETFSNLNGNTDEVYKIIARWVNGGGLSSNYSIEPNGIGANQEGRALKSEFITGPTVNVITSLMICTVQGSEFAFSESLFYARRVVAGVAQNRFIISRCSETRPTATDVFGENNYAAWLDTTTDVTSLDIVANQAAGIGVGTTIALYKGII